MQNLEQIKKILENGLEIYYNRDFIKNDPICIVHKFSKKNEIELVGFIVSIFSFGKRSIIIKKVEELIKKMNFNPYEFVINFEKEDEKFLENICHRTINFDDLVFIIKRLKNIYEKYESIENCFSQKFDSNEKNIEKALINFHELFFENCDKNFRSRKHIPSPKKNSSCKRMNMFLKWMVRKDEKKVDFGIWNKIKPSQLICPCDVHVVNICHKIGIIEKKNYNWKTALEITERLAYFCPEDPIKYDFSIFSMGEDKFFDKKY
jgi:uncharacterized protein (TIGR02757 family)